MWYGVVVSEGGFLFQHYVETNARGQNFKDYKKALTTRRGLNTEIDIVLQKRLLDKYKAGFVLWLLSSAGVSGYQQLFYIIFVLEYKGLSRSGIEMLHRMHVSLSLRTFDAHRKAALAKVDDANRYVP